VIGYQVVAILEVRTSGMELNGTNSKLPNMTFDSRRSKGSPGAGL